MKVYFVSFCRFLLILVHLSLQGVGWYNFKTLLIRHWYPNFETNINSSNTNKTEEYDLFIQSINVENCRKNCKKILHHWIYNIFLNWPPSKTDPLIRDHACIPAESICGFLLLYVCVYLCVCLYVCLCIWVDTCFCIIRAF